jgi:hypothetical protein
VIRLALLAFLVGCAQGEWPDVERGAEELQAREMVWASLGALDEAPPSVSWEAGEACPMRTGGGRYIVFGSDNGPWRCLSGWYWEPDHHARVIWTDRISDSSYAHELYHGWLWLHTGDLDPGHLGAGWATAVPHANALLRDAGL